MAKQAVDNKTIEIGILESWQLVMSVERRIAQLQEKIRKLHEDYSAKVVEMRGLENQGLIYAGTTWKDGKYLVLIYPAKEGEDRKRVYIGSDREKIAETMAGLDRAAQFEKLKSQVNSLEQWMKHYDYQLSNCK